MIPLVAFALLMAAAADWPQWRGPQRDAVMPASAAPPAWPEKLKLRWRITVGEGHASPILAGGRIYLQARQQDKEVVSAVDLENGKVIWQQSNPAPYTMHPAATQHGKGPKSTPVFAEGRLYTLGISGILTCWDATTGAVKWRKDFVKDHRSTSPDFGAAMSPVVDRGLLLAHLGGHDDGALMALDAVSGVTKWSWNGDGPAYASPLVIELSGVRQVVTETQNNIVGLSETDGHLLWKIPFTTDYDQNIPTPVIYHDEVIVSGISKGVMAVRPRERDGKWSAETVWRNPDVALYMSSPVDAGDLLFGFSHYKRGQLFCLDLRTGKTQWAGEPRQADNAALLIAGDNLIVLRDDAKLMVAKAGGTGFAPSHSYTVADSPTWAHPLVLPDGVVIKDATTLARWGVN